SKRTKLVAVGMASNGLGTINPVATITREAKAAGAWVFLDAVHFAPHGPINVQELGCDFLACSAYKFFGPHVGILWGRRELLKTIPAYKIRPAPDSLPGKWMTGTQNHEGLAGVAAAVDYLSSVGACANQPATPARADASNSYRIQLLAAMTAIQNYERTLSERL